ncbi:uncharacterized protein LOC111640362 isoform X1 [Centruroides sculpturatus]|uniref:uncharacterized protein LOC111640362 isoform X1 n=1 Tax=Centruroides sculpturatus TaxID=218467 RepID=UPI000C6D7E8A|nr:uncharacterized protein LOC111640362 isoform X1 [Centruroides sculpturatus]
MKSKIVNSREILFFLLICTILIVPHGCSPLVKVQVCGHDLYTMLVNACLSTLISWRLTEYRAYYDDFFSTGAGSELVDLCCENKCEESVFQDDRKCELLIPVDVSIDFSRPFLY